MTTAISGKAGTVTGATGVGEITEWTCTVEVEALDVTSMASAGWREFIEGLKQATGNLKCVGAKPELETVASLVLKTDQEVTPKATITGKALIRSVEYSVPVAGEVAYTANFTFTGEVTVT